MPFSKIAEELSTLRELYELDLASRHIYRLTEKPSKGDTEVSYSSEDIMPKSKLRSMFDGTPIEPEEED